MGKVKFARLNVLEPEDPVFHDRQVAKTVCRMRGLIVEHSVELPI